MSVSMEQIDVQAMKQVRVQANELIERMKTDAAFREQVLQDPRSALVAAGLPAQAVLDFLVETRLTGGADIRSEETAHPDICILTCYDTGPTYTYITTQLTITQF